MITLQKAILELIACGESLHTTMSALCTALERRMPGVLCSVVGVDHGGLLYPVCGQSLPAGFQELLDRVPIGPMAGSCGTAIYFNQTVSVTDIASDPRWEIGRDVALRNGLQACWSSPITDGTGRVLGALAFYYREKRGPTGAEKRLVNACLNLCSIAFERQERVREREHRATHDDLTGLGNRAAFNALLSRLTCAQPGSWGLLAIDLDNLKTVNDTFGHQGGDDLLRMAASRIAAAAAPDITFRIGGDEFVVLLQSPESLIDIEATAQRIFAELGMPGDCGGFLVTPAASIGGAVVSPEDDLPETVRQNADHALYFAKETGRGRFVRYWSGLGSPISDRIRMVRRLEAALRDDRVEAWYQPIVSFETGQPLGLEALCRLRTSDGSTFSGLDLAMIDAQAASELTQRMIATVTRDLASWRRGGIDLPFIAMNVCAADLYSPSFAQTLAGEFEACGLPLDRLVIDVNEAMHACLREPVVRRSIGWLRERGVRIALDDFGRNVGSLVNLLAAPIDAIKLDPALMGSLAPDRPATEVVGALIATATRLDIIVVAESVETQRQVDQLRRFGCRWGQGHYFAGPMPGDEAARLLAGHVARPAFRIAG